MLKKLRRNRKKTKLTKIPIKDLTTLSNDTLKHLDLGKKLKKLRPGNLNELQYNQKIVNEVYNLFRFFTVPVDISALDNHPKNIKTSQMRPE